MRDAIVAIVVELEAGEALVAAQRVTASCSEIDDTIEIGAGEACIGLRGAHLGEERVGRERRAARHAQHMLRQHVERARAIDDGILGARHCGVERGAALQNFEAIARHQQCPRRLVEAVIGAANALDEAARALRRADVDDEIDVAPVDAQIQRRGAHDRAQSASGHGRFDLAPLRDIERTVMQRDRQVGVIDLPQRVEHQLGLHARVDEDECQLVRRDRLQDLAHRVACRVTGPWQLAFALEQTNVGHGAAFGFHQIGEQDVALGHRLRGEPSAQLGRARHGRRQPGDDEARHQRAQARNPQRQQVAALGGGERMQFVEDHRLEASEKPGGLLAREQQGELLGCRQQNLGRVDALPLAATNGRVAGSRFDAHGQSHLGDGCEQVACDVDRQRLERRDIEHRQPRAATFGARRLGGERDQAGEETGERLAGARGGDQQGGAARAPLGHEGELMRTGLPAARAKPSVEGLGQCRTDGGRRGGDAYSPRRRWRAFPLGERTSALTGSWIGHAGVILRYRDSESISKTSGDASTWIETGCWEAIRWAWRCG